MRLITASRNAAGAAGVGHDPVAPGRRVNVRSGPGTNHAVVRVLGVGAKAAIHCRTRGARESGPYGTSTVRDSSGSGRFVSDACVQTGGDGYVAPRCA
ncbi:SH3 domain-containing protein [Streptomyces sp. NPDC059459]|uniref:SH3 domain-containing protein n=1 Tax=unclassified Streptomyces TaxID=2593676 RepID=UPI0036BE214E